MTQEPPSPPRPNGWQRPVIGPFTLRHLVLLAVVLLVAGSSLSLLSMPITAPAAQVPAPGSGFYQLAEPTTGLAVGQRAPELEREAEGAPVPLLDLEGRPLRLADRLGGPVWLSFFATWCPPCQEETPVLREAHRRYADDGLRMIAISVQETTADDVAAYAETYSLSYPIGFDATSEVFHAYGGFGLPTHVFLDDEGVIQRIQLGPLALEQVAAIVEPLLAAAP